MSNFSRFFWSQIGWLFREAVREQKKRQSMPRFNTPSQTQEPHIPYHADKFYVYALQDTGKVFSIGATVDPLNELDYLFQESKKKKTPLQKYIYQMRETGKSPDLIILHETTDREEARTAMEKFINLYIGLHKLYFDLE